MKVTENKTIFGSIEEFEDRLAHAFELAKVGDEVEIWEGGDYYTLRFYSLQSAQDKRNYELQQ